MSISHDPVVKSLRHLHQKMEGIGTDLHNFMDRQAHGAAPDPEEFVKLLKAQSVTKSAMSAQFNLLQKPFKIVLNEAK
jgi:hypothetical protein